MKTYELCNGVMREVVNRQPGGAFVKTADHFEAVAELETRNAELRRELDHANMRYRGAISQVTALVEQLAKGVTVQAPAPHVMRRLDRMPCMHTLRCEKYAARVGEDGRVCIDCGMLCKATP